MYHMNTLDRLGWELPAEKLYFALHLPGDSDPDGRNRTLHLAQGDDVRKNPGDGNPPPGSSGIRYEIA